MLHPFLCSQNVWRTVADQLADTGRFEVFAPTMLGHNGGPPSPSLAPGHRRRWSTTSSGGWTGWAGRPRTSSATRWAAGSAFELERRGRARTLTAIAPAGGWSQHSVTKYETVLKFILGGPALIAARLLGPRILDLPFARRIATLPVSGPADGPPDADLRDLVDDATHCSAYLQLLVKTLRMPGLLELANLGAPTQLVVCEKDRVFPAPRGHRYFLKHLPASTEVIHLDGVGPHPDAGGAGPRHRGDRRLRRPPPQPAAGVRLISALQT